ncbi:NAD-dependent DNA ligase LigA, partial [Candidatus Parcubacteria bacterium]
MNRQEAKKRIEKLRSEINRQRYLYHVLDRPEISDGALDSLKQELQKLEEQFPEFITPDSPTQRVGGRPLEKFEKVSHSSPMYSMFDSFTKDDLLAWEERNRNFLAKRGIRANWSYFCELKMDGLAVSL